MRCGVGTWTHHPVSRLGFAGVWYTTRTRNSDRGGRNGAFTLRANLPPHQTGHIFLKQVEHLVLEGVRHQSSIRNSLTWEVRQDITEFVEETLQWFTNRTRPCLRVSVNGLSERLQQASVLWAWGYLRTWVTQDCAHPHPSLGDISLRLPLISVENADSLYLDSRH